MKNSEKIGQVSVQKDTTLIQVLKRMDELDKKLLIVFDGNKYIGLISIGDIQRAIIKNQPLNSEIGSIMRRNVRVCVDEADGEAAEGDRDEYEQRYRGRPRQRHPGRHAALGTDQRQRALHEGDEQREDEGEGAEFGDHGEWGKRVWGGATA